MSKNYEVRGQPQKKKDGKLVFNVYLKRCRKCGKAETAQVEAEATATAKKIEECFSDVDPVCSEHW